MDYGTMHVRIQINSSNGATEYSHGCKPVKKNRITFVPALGSVFRNEMKKIYNWLASPAKRRLTCIKLCCKLLINRLLEILKKKIDHKKQENAGL